ncbi:MAG: glycosyltransferase family 39 protein [Candidatus Eisenbacteria bacterium]|nr:glycosyltransferase family 39 protein [Candidatus Eisenbacteria bacterium]
MPKRSARSRKFRLGRIWWWIIIAAALLYRGAYLWEASSRPDFHLFTMDQEYHLGWAEGIAEGRWPPPFDALKDAPYFRAPLYPWFLAALFFLFGKQTVLFRIAQMVIGSLSSAMAGALGARFFGRRTGVLAGSICAFYWVFAYFDGELLLPVLLVFFVLLGFLLLHEAIERGSVPLSGASGLAFGLYAITRPNILLFFPFAFFWLFRHGPRGRARFFLLLFAAGSLLPAAGVTIRNRVVGGDWVGIASQGGVNFYIGNNPESNGMEAVVPGTRATWWGGFEDTKRIAEEAAGRPLLPSAVSDYWFGRAFDFIRNDPGRWARLTLRKTIALLGNAELPNNEPYEARRSRFLAFRVVPLGFAPLLGFFLASLPAMIAAGRRSGRRPEEKKRGAFLTLILWFLAIYAATIVAFFVTGRYRVPLVPFVALGASWTVVRIAERLRGPRPADALRLLLPAVLITAALYADPLGVRESTRGFAALSEAQDLLDSGDPAAAVPILEGILAEGSMRQPEVYRALTRAYAGRRAPGDREAILRTAREGLLLDPDAPDLLWYAAVGETNARNWEEAMDLIDRYLRIRPDDVRGCYLGFTAALAMERRDEAERYLRLAEAADPNHETTARMREILASAPPSPR